MSKPILSELEYNADDVASAILQKADLSLTNENLGVTDIASILVAQSGWALEFEQMFAFNGFAFVCFRCSHAGGTPSHNEALLYLNDSDYHPIDTFLFPSVSHLGDYSQRVEVRDDGYFYVNSPAQDPTDTYYIVINGYFRYA